jgi:FtsP/CotA-like multicopper oxidase with cupredoxin domain
LTYNGKIPGPPIRVPEGQPVRIVLHNQLKVPTSLVFHGVVVPQSVGGLPKKDSGIVKPGEAYAYQFVPSKAGTFWYHPQVINADQKSRGMFGAFIVEPRSGPSEDKDFTVVLSELNLGAGAEGTAHPVQPLKSATSHTYYLMNGKAAPAIPPIELRQGERVRLRVVNAGQHAIPLYLSGHRFEVMSINGSDNLEPHVYRDTITLNPSDRVDLSFAADNPGVWSFASELLEQASNEGKFPGGIACVVRYSGQ